jgi:hypothetical protein
MGVRTFQEIADLHLIYGLHIATAGRPGISTSKVFRSSNFLIGKRASTLIVACEKQERLSLVVQVRGGYCSSKHNLENDIRYHRSTRRTAEIERISPMTVLSSASTALVHVPLAECPARVVLCDFFCSSMY